MRFISNILLLFLAVLLPAVALAGSDIKLLLDTPKEPVPAYQFKSITSAGKAVALADFRGKVVFVNFWATWCIPCLREMPAMERLNRKMKGRPFKMLAVNMQEDKEIIARYSKKHGLTFDMVLDTNGEIAGNYAADKLPLTYLLNKNGDIVKRAVGPREWDSQQAIDLLLKMMQEAGKPSPAKAAVKAPETSNQPADKDVASVLGLKNAAVVSR